MNKIHRYLTLYEKKFDNTTTFIIDNKKKKQEEHEHRRSELKEK